VSIARPSQPVLVVEDHDDVRDMLETLLAVDGYQVRTAAHGRQAPAVAQTPIVLVTAVSDADKVRQQTGALAVIPKPIDLDRVVETVGRLCRRPCAERH
jgi:DNA-binding NtrC family response regulator